MKAVFFIVKADLFDKKRRFREKLLKKIMKNCTLV